MSGRRWLRRTAVPAALAVLACGDGTDAGPAPRPLAGTSATPAPAPSAGEQARALAGNPRLLLFDLQTALESVNETRGSYPTLDEFQATDSWALQRAALDAAFEAWTYESDGRTYRLSGESGGRTFVIQSP